MSRGIEEMNRILQRKMKTNQQRFLLENLQQNEEVYYLTSSSGGGFELKRPNIISRRNNTTKLQALNTLSSTVNHTPLISYVESYGPNEITVAPDSIPIELISSDSFFVSEPSYPIVSELSLTLEPTVVSQPIPAEIPFTYDSTCVSQAIPTPIPTPLVTSNASSSSVGYIESSTPTFHMYCEREEDANSDGNTSGISTYVLNGVGSESIFVTSVDSITTAGNQYQVTMPPPDEVRSANDTFATVQPENQLRIEAQLDGSLVLYLDSSSTDIVSDAEIIQADTFPVGPKVPVELPSQKIDGQTESFILVPFDEYGNTVMVPTSSILKAKARPTPRRATTNSVNLSGFQNGLVSTRSVLNDTNEKPKPYRYELPEDSADSDTFESSVMANLNLTSLASQFHFNQKESETHDTFDNSMVRGDEGGGVDMKMTEPMEVSHDKHEKGKETETSESDDGKVFERTALGVFKCKFCKRESRLKVLLLNHVKKSHKRNGIQRTSQDSSKQVSSRQLDHASLPPSVDYISLQREGQRNDEEQVTFTLVSATSSDMTTNSPMVATDGIALFPDTETLQLLEGTSPAPISTNEQSVIKESKSETVVIANAESEDDRNEANRCESYVSAGADRLNSHIRKRKRTEKKLNPKIKKTQTLFNARSSLLQSQCSSVRSNSLKTNRLTNESTTVRMRTRSHSSGVSLRNPH